MSQEFENIGHIGSEDGLISQLCTRVIEDDLGNLWISTFRDIHKFDGYSMETFSLANYKIKPEQAVVELIKDKAGNIWVIQGLYSRISSGIFVNHHILDCNIFVINPITDEVLSFEDYTATANLKSKNVKKIYFNSGNIYLLTEQHEFFRYSDKLEKFEFLDDYSQVLGLNPKEEVYLFKNDSLSIVDLKGGLKYQYSIDEFDGFEMAQVTFEGDIFLISYNGASTEIHEFDYGEIKLIAAFQEKSIYLSENTLDHGKIELFGDKHLHANKSIYIKNKNGKFELKPFDRKLDIQDYYVSGSGLGYAATNLGVYVFGPKNILFKKLANDESSMNTVRSVFINEDIMAYKVYNKEKIISKSDRFNLSFLKAYDLGYIAYSHYQDPLDEKSLWSVGFLNEGSVRKINFEKETIEIFKIKAKGRFTTNNILRSSFSQNLYLSTSIGPLVFNEEEGAFVKISQGSAFVEQIGTNHIVEVGDQIWFASDLGILKYNERLDFFELKRIFKEGKSYPVQFIYLDKSDTNIAWLGTMGGGLVKWDTLSDSIEIFNTSNGLSNDDVHAIIEDKQDRLWVSTNRNLNCLDKKNNSIYIFTEQEGISNSEFNKYGYFEDTKNNLIYFGGLNGYNYFNPDSIDTSIKNKKINVRCIGVEIVKQNGEIDDGFEEYINTGQIEFTEEDLTLNIQLSTNYLFDNEDIKFSYRIQGFQNEWRTQSSNELKLSRMPYGEYVLEVISDLNKPSLTSNINRMDLVVIRPFVKSWLFYTLVFFTGMVLTWLGIIIYNRRLIRQNLKLERTIAISTEELEEALNTKNKIFAILAHDLRDPISSLSNLTEKISFLAQNNRLDELQILTGQTDIRLNALNDNLSNVLYWALSENEMLDQKPEKLSLLLEINKILEIYDQEIEEKKLSVNIDFEDVDQVMVDISVLQTILRNFINNAIKFSYKEGSISFIKSFEDEENIELTIKDDGIGMEANTEKNLDINADKIYREGKGSGIGLIITKELIKVAGIQLQIISELKKGTSIKLLLPKNLRLR